MSLVSFVCSSHELMPSLLFLAMLSPPYLLPLVCVSVLILCLGASLFVYCPVSSLCILLASFSPAAHDCLVTKLLNLIHPLPHHLPFS